MFIRICVYLLLLAIAIPTGAAAPPQCPTTSTGTDIIFQDVPPDKLVGGGRFCPAVAVPVKPFHYGFGLSVGRLRQPDTRHPNPDIVVSDSQPPRLSYFWWDSMHRKFKREVIFAGPSLDECEKKHFVPRDDKGAQMDCLVFESSFVADINCDGFDDIVVISYRHPTSIFWFENPGRSRSGWKRHPITNAPFQDGSEVSLVSGSSPYSLPAGSVFSAAPLRRGERCGRGKSDVDIVYGSHTVNTGLTLLRNPGPGAGRYSGSWEATSLTGTSGKNIRTLMPLPRAAHGSSDTVARVMYAPAIDDYEDRSKYPAVRIFPSTPAILSVSADWPPKLQSIGQVNDRAFGYAVGTFATLRPKEPPAALIPYGTMSQRPCWPADRTFEHDQYTDNGVTAYQWAKEKKQWKQTGLIFGGKQFPWPHHVAAGRISADAVDDVVVGTMCSKVDGTPGDQPVSQVVYCRNPRNPAGKGETWSCEALATDLPGVPFVAIVDVDGDGINDVVAQTNGFAGHPGRLLWFKGRLPAT